MPAITEFTSVDLIEGMEALIAPESFLNQTFFPRTTYFTGRFCQVDSRKARRWLAPVVKRNQIGRVVAREPITTKFFEVPELRPTRETSVADLDDRLLGESQYSRRSPSERLIELVAADIRDLVDSVTRRVEQMTSSVLFTGAFSYLLDDGSTEVLSYGAITPIVPSVLWDATSGSDPCKDLSNAANTIIANSGLVPDTVVMGSDVLSTSLNNTTVQSQLDNTACPPAPNSFRRECRGVLPATPLLRNQLFRRLLHFLFDRLKLRFVGRHFGFMRLHGAEWCSLLSPAKIPFLALHV